MAWLRGRLGPEVPSAARSSEQEAALILGRLAWKAFGNPDETLGAPLDAAERARVSAMSLRELCAEIHAGHEQCKALVARVRPGEGEYIGVRRGKRGRTFEAQIRRPGTGMQFLGTFCTAAEAAHAYDNAAFKQDGQSAILNWPQGFGLEPNKERLALIAERLSRHGSKGQRDGRQPPSAKAPAAKARRVPIIEGTAGTADPCSADELCPSDGHDDDDDDDEIWCMLLDASAETGLPPSSVDTPLGPNAPIVHHIVEECINEAVANTPMSTAAELAAAIDSDDYQVVARAVAIYVTLDEPTLRAVFEIAKHNMTEAELVSLSPEDILQDASRLSIPERNVPEDMPNMQDHPSEAATPQNLMQRFQRVLHESRVDESAEEAVDGLLQRYRAAPLSECRPDLLDPDNDDAAGAMYQLACVAKRVDYDTMDWASAEAHRDRLAEWGLDGNPERRQNPFEAHRPPGTLTAATDATEPDPLARMPAALLDMVQRGDGAMTPGVGIPAAQLPPRPASPPLRTPAHWGPQLHDPEWLAIRETWKKILDGDPHYKNVRDLLGMSNGGVSREVGLERLEALFGPHVAAAVAFREPTPEPLPPGPPRRPPLPGRPSALFPRGTHMSYVTGKEEPIDLLAISGDPEEPGYDLEWAILELGAATGYGPPGPAHANPAGFVRYATSVLDCFEGMPFEERREVLALQVANRCLLREEHAEDDGVLRL